MGYGQADGPKPDHAFKHPDAMMNEALDWFVRLQDRPVDPETMAGFEAWRAASPAGSAAFDQLERMRTMPALRKATEIDAKALGFGPGSSRARQAGPLECWSRRIAAVAAAAVLAVGVWQYPALMLRWQADYLTATGERDSITLPDGSAMTLNTASAVALEFAGGQRRVRLLAGEAFFDVRHDAARPFVVAAGFSEVEVKGTAFAVRTDDKRDLVVLERGKVDVTRLSNRDEHAMLDPGQMVIATANALSPVTNTDPDESLAWREGRIVFSERPFPQALADLRRYYNGSVIVADGRLSGVLVSGNYRIDDPEDAIRTLATSAGVSATRLPGGILILR